MASSVVHLAITNELTKEMDFEDINRLKFGAVVVDAGSYGKSHLKVNVSDGKKKCYDFDRYHWNPMIPGNVERLHKDYSIVNYYVVTKYCLKNDLVVPGGFENEDINRIVAQVRNTGSILLKN